MSVSLLPPEIRRVFDDLQRRVGILERRINPKAVSATDTVRHWALVGLNMGNSQQTYQTIELVAGIDNMVQAFAGPIDINTNTVRPEITAPTYGAGILAFRAWMMVWTPDVTQRLRANYGSFGSPIPVASGAIWTPDTETVTTSFTTGTDLYIDSDSQVATHNPQTLLAHLFVIFDSVPDPV